MSCAQCGEAFDASTVPAGLSCADHESVCATCWKAFCPLKAQFWQLGCPVNQCIVDSAFPPDSLLAGGASAKHVDAMKEELETMSLRCMITRGDFGAPEPSHIEGRVYLGNEQNAFNQSQLDAVGITHVLNMAGQCKNYWATNYTYKHIMMLDQEGWDLPVEACVAFIDDTLAAKDSNKVFVHCVEGKSRSASIVAAWVMKHHNIGVQDAIKFVHERRQCAYPATWFYPHLNAYAKKLGVAEIAVEGESTAATTATAAVAGGGGAGGGAGAGTAATAATAASAAGNDGGAQKKLVVAVDLDEVLGQFVPMLVKWHNRTQAGPELKVETFHSYEFKAVWGGTEPEAIAKVHDFFESPEFVDGIPLVPGAKEAMRRLHDTGLFRMVLVTSRQSSLEAVTRAWVEQHFEGIFDEVVLGNHYGVSGAKRSKPDLCKELGARVIVDDRVKYARTCSPVVDKVILFGKYAWNGGIPQDKPVAGGPEDSPLPDNVVRVTDWKEAEALLLQLVSSKA